MTSIIPSNVGLKTMNSLDLENALMANLKIIEKLDKQKGLLEKVMKSLKGKDISLKLLLNATREITGE
jgi:hypothetical protein